MLKKLVLTVVILAALLAYASPALAQTAPNLYVDTAYTGTTETGSPTQPYKTLTAAVSAAQALTTGANIYQKNATTGAWDYYGYIAPVNGGETGTPLSTPAMFGLLALVSLSLIAGGWFVLRRSRTRAQLAA